jgi:hypothetical protein
METKENTILINVAIEILGQKLCMCLLFVHVKSGCNTTSALNSIRKTKHLKLLQSSYEWRSDVIVFDDSSASLQEVTDVGELSIQSLYSGGFTLSRGNDHHHHLQKISTKYIPAQRLPPTSRACYFHCVRVHQQVNTWIQLKITLNKEHYVFRVQGGRVFSIFTDMEAAPLSSCSSSSAHAKALFKKNPMLFLQLFKEKTILQCSLQM